ncbi:Benzyl alcohol O-benzoyltransferase, partial [Mucuna pruriens]
MASSTLVFTVRRRQPEQIAPAKPTPREVKKLSDIDDQQGLRFQIPFVQFYRNDASMEGKDPVEVIRQALSQTLIFYYPFAGRLREGPGRKLLVDCTGEGVLFIEADADVTLQQFGRILHPPFPCLDQLLYDIPGSRGITHCPLLLIQVTRLKCGGFIFALRLNHSMSDGFGIAKFMNALAEIARGAKEPSLTPVWCRELLNARDPPRISRIHHEYEEVVLENKTEGTTIPLKDVAQRCFFFGPTEVSALRRLVSKHVGRCTTFEVITACMWRCRIRALQVEPNDVVRFISTVNINAKVNPPLPSGYYGNEFVLSAAVTTAQRLCENPFGYALELIKNAKANVDEEYVRSMTDLMVVKGRPHNATTRSYLVTNTTRLGLNEMDLGWGKPIYGGPATCGITNIPQMTSVYMSYQNDKGEYVIVVPIMLPPKAMNRFATELDRMLRHQGQPIIGAPGLVSKL